MITLIDRRTIFSQHKIIQSEITKLQKALFDDDMLEAYKFAGEENEYRQQFDVYGCALTDYSAFYETIKCDFQGILHFTKDLTQNLTAIFDYLAIKDLYVLCHLKLDYFGNINHDYLPVRLAYQQLEQLLKAQTYNEAFKLNLNDLQVFVDIIFWLTRCDISAPEYIFLFDMQEKISIQLCKFGNVHLSQFKQRYLTDETLNNLGWKRR